jgi:hypothetical protein
MQLQWTAVTGFHDWSASDRAAAREFLGHARSLDLLGELEWYTDPSYERLPATPGVTLDTLLAGKAKRNQPFGFEAGGEQPSPWKVAILLSHWNKATQEPYGYSRLNVWLESRPFEGTESSTKLASTFRAAHGAHNTEFAFIHPHERRSQLSDVEGRYADPITNGLTFTGVYWATFLGPQHLARFDEDKLKALSAHRFELVPKTSLYVQVSPDIADATSPEVEAEMFRLSDAFRAALRT